jgi:hypothetical protein
MVSKLSVILFLAALSALAFFAVGRSRKPFTFDARAMALCVTFAVLAGVYIYWKSRPA